MSQRKIVITINEEVENQTGVAVNTKGTINTSSKIVSNIQTKAIGKFKDISEVIKYMVFALEDLKKLTEEQRL